MKTRFFSNIECHIVIGLYVKYHKEMSFIFENSDPPEKYPHNILCHLKLYSVIHNSTAPSKELCKAHSLADMFCALILRFQFTKKISFL